MKRISISTTLLLLIAAACFAQEPESRSVSVDGVKIHYLDSGDRKQKNALVLVHCWTCDSSFWEKTSNAFSGNRVITIDLPGHGKSDKPERDYTVEYFARSVRAVMDDANVKRAVLAGHSMGTPIVRRFYELFPEKTAGIVIVDGALLPYGDRAEVDKFFAPLFADYKNEAPKFINGMLPADADLAGRIRSAMLGTPEHVGKSAMKFMQDDAYAEHGKIDVPVLAIMAPSPYWPADLESRYRTIAPNLEFQIWPGTSHFLHMERPTLFNGQMKGFIIRNKLL